MVKAREQSKTLNYTDPFKIDQIPALDFSLALEFYFKVTFIFANIRLTILYINLICNWSYSDYGYMYNLLYSCQDAYYTKYLRRCNIYLVNNVTL